MISTSSPAVTLRTAKICQFQAHSRQAACTLGHGGRPIMADEADEAMRLRQRSKLEGSHKMTAGLQNIQVHLGRSLASSYIFEQLLKTQDFDSVGSFVNCGTTSTAFRERSVKKKTIFIPEKHLLILNKDRLQRSRLTLGTNCPFKCTIHVKCWRGEKKGIRCQCWFIISLK